MVLKKCIVPRCRNTSENEPDKLFIRPPHDALARQRWQLALKLEKEISSNSRSCCCEDHFNLQEDCLNWTYYCLLGTNVSLKPNVVPHLYVDAEPPKPLPPQMSSSTKKRKILNQNAFSNQSTSQETLPAKQNLFEKTMVNLELIPIKQVTVLCSSRAQHSTKSPSETFDIQNQYCDKGVQVKITAKVRSKAIQCNDIRPVHPNSKSCLIKF